MNSNSSLNRSKNVVLSGLNQIYSSTIEEISSFNQITSIFINNLLKNSEISKESLEGLINYCSNKTIDNSTNFDVRKFKQEFETYIKDQLVIKEFNINTLLNLSNFFVIDKSFLQSFIDQNIYITITNSNKLYLYYEYVILEYFNFADILIFNLENEVKQNITNNPKSYIVCSHELYYLYEFHQLNCWTIYLASFVYNSYFYKADFDLNVITAKNNTFIKNNGKFFCMAAGNIIQIEYYIKEIFQIAEKSKETKIEILNSLFNNLITKNDPIKVLYLHMIIFKKNELQKAHHYKSNDKIIFLPYFGFEEYEEITLNSDDFDLILLKFSTQQEYDFLQTLQKSLIRFVDEKTNKKGQKIQFVNSLKPMESFYHRINMSMYLDQFLKSDQIKPINEKFNTKTFFPTYYSVNLADVYDEEPFLNFLVEKKLELPIIIKHSGPVEFGHLLACIISPEGLKNYHAYIKNISSAYNRNELDLVIQQFNNHNGYFVKLFYINDKAFSYVRPSIPNLFEHLKVTEDRFEKGFYALVTDDLLTQSYLEFWNRQNNVQIEDKINFDYLQKVSDAFKSYSGVTLFGLDFIYDTNKNEYFLIDMNHFPGYKELIDDFSYLIAEQILKLKQ